MRTVTPSFCTVTLLTISLTFDDLVSSGLLENQWHAVLLENQLFRVFTCEIARKREMSVWRKVRNTWRAEIYCIPSISSLLPVLSPPPLLVALLKPFWVLSMVGRLFHYADAGPQQRWAQLEQTLHANCEICWAPAFSIIWEPKTYNCDCNCLLSSCNRYFSLLRLTETS